MSNDAVEVLLWAGGIGFSVLAGMCGVIGYLLSRDSQRRDRREERGEDEFGRTREHLSSKQAGQGETLAGVVARVVVLERDNGKCDGLAADIAVLKSHRMSDDRRAEKLDDALTDIAGMKRDIKTLFTQNAELPEKVVSLLMSRVNVRKEPRAANG